MFFLASVFFLYNLCFSNFRLHNFFGQGPYFENSQVIFTLSLML